ncbi:glucose inhibited division protein a [Holotrichia oblita]|nr:glucose inhibited division protein a [Holotrichia oblita]
MKNFDVVIIGAGHAGCEEDGQPPVLGCKVLLATMNLDSIAYLACNPSIGGTAKGHLVCEIDALGSIMGIIADKTALQIRMLNVGKGAAVFSLRAQADKIKYHNTMKQTLENIENITIKQAEVAEILTGGYYVTGVKFTSMNRILIGNFTADSGPSGFANSSHLTKSLINLGLEIRRFKTGTPPRVNSRTIDFSKTDEQLGDDNIQTFSFITRNPIKNIVKCHLTYTNPETHKIIRDNIHLSAMYSGKIEGVGARYCPSIEDKIVRFAGRDRHQVFLEPESLNTNETYLQGISTSLPAGVQEQFVHSIAGLENAQIMRDAYAIEYNCINSLQLFPTLEYKSIKGINAARRGVCAPSNTISDENRHENISIHSKNAEYQPFVLSRTESYVGVLIDDLVTVGTNEPYRMFTSRAEHRLYLRQDNADLRLTPVGREIGLVDDYRWRIFNKKLKQIEKVRERSQDKVIWNNEKMTIEQVLKRSNLNLKTLNEELKIFNKIPTAVADLITNEVKYAGYLTRENAKIAEAKRHEATLLPHDFNYSQITSLRKEAQIKLNQIKPQNIAQATRISGVTPADINVILVYFKKNPIK